MLAPARGMRQPNVERAPQTVAAARAEFPCETPLAVIVET